MSADSSVRLFEYRDGRSDKFWEIRLEGTSHTVRYGRVGTDGQTVTKEFATDEKALASCEKLIRQKEAKGYKEVNDPSDARSEQVKLAKLAKQESEPFIETILESPDDFQGYAVYADWLSEQGDPRGELIQVQWQLGSTELTGKPRKEAEKRERELIKTNRSEWLNELAPELTDDWLPDQFSWLERPAYDAQFARGFLDALKIQYLFPEFATKLKRSGMSRMLRRLQIVYLARGEELADEVESYADRDWGWEDCPSIEALIAGGTFDNLRHLEISEGDHGCHIVAPNVHKLVAKAPRLETLIVEAHEVDTEALFQQKMPNLRSLTVNHLTDYPLPALANNRSLQQLESLEIRPHAFEYDDDEAYIVLEDIRAICRSENLGSLKHLYLQCTDFGDDGIDEIIQSGILQRLETLKLPSGATTDQGAERLAAADLGTLKRLDLSGNYLSSSTVAKLRKQKISISCDGQNDPATLGSERMHLYDGDME